MVANQNKEQANQNKEENIAEDITKRTKRHFLGTLTRIMRKKARNQTKLDDNLNCSNSGGVRNQTKFDKIQKQMNLLDNLNGSNSGGGSLKKHLVDNYNGKLPIPYFHLK